MNIIKRIRASLRLTEAIRQADAAADKSGARHFVMPTTGTSGQLIIMDRKNFRILKRKGYISHNAKMKDLESRCFYCTDWRGKNSAIIAWGRRSYYVWLESLGKRDD